MAISNSKIQIYGALRKFFAVELRNEDQGGIRPATLGSALGSWQQAPEDVLKQWCHYEVNLDKVEEELKLLIEIHGEDANLMQLFAVE
jgi:hypothetical protein